jgi:hypothetical protein
VGGTFGWVIPLSNPQSINVDFNRDNITDRASVDGTSDVVVSLGNADGTYQAPRTFAAGSNAGFVTAGDFNGDGWTDIAVVKHQSNSLTVLSNDGNW